MHDVPKAYIYQNYEGEAIIFFASSVGKARNYAFQSDICTEDDYKDIRVRRCPSFDHMLKPEGYELDWNKDEDRIEMVGKAGFVCRDIDPEECAECVCKDSCDTYSDYIEEAKG